MFLRLILKNKLKNVLFLQKKQLQTFATFLNDFLTIKNFKNPHNLAIKN